MKQVKPQAKINPSRSWAQLKGGPVFACIDMGTNSFHMIVCQASPKRDHFDVITRVKEAVPFFRGALGAHFIDDVALRAATRILAGMIKHAREHKATTIMAVATSAVRESTNGEEVLMRIRRELGLDVRMISGKEEARLIYLGVLWSMPKLSGNFAIADIGGGSTEVILGDRDQIFFAESYKLGAARLTQRFFKGNAPTARTIRELHDEVTGVLRPAAAGVNGAGSFQQLIGTSGTIQTMAKIDRVRSGHAHDELHGYRMALASVEDIVAYLEEGSLKGGKIKGVSSDRKETILAGSIVLLETMRSLQAKEVMVCNAALREGVVVDRFLQTGWLTAGLEGHRDPRSDSVHRLLEKYQASVEHAEQVARLASAIFIQTHGILHNYSEASGHLLWSAAMLHDVGMFVGRNGHHKHSYYLIKNGGLLGHSEEEVSIIAAIARYHRGSPPKEMHEAYCTIPATARKAMTDMACMLRLAEALDRGHRQAVKDIRVVLTPARKNEARVCTVIIAAKPGETCQSEIWAVNEKKSFFEDQFQVKVNVSVNSNKPQLAKAT